MPLDCDPKEYQRWKRDEVIGVRKQNRGCRTSWKEHFLLRMSGMRQERNSFIEIIHPPMQSVNYFLFVYEEVEWGITTEKN